MSKEIENKIKKFQKLIDNPKSTDEEVAKYKKFIEKLKSKLPKKEPKKPVKKNVVKKPEPKRVIKKKTTPKKKKGVKMISSKRAIIDGKEVDMDSKEFCDYLVSNFKDRRSKSKEGGKKKKTTSVMERVSANIEKGISQAIKAGEKDKKVQIKKNPKPFIAKVEKLETSTKSFLQDLKSVMGNEYDSSEVSSTVKSINRMIEELKKKINEKK